RDRTVTGVQTCALPICDTALIDKKAGFIDAVNPDLSAFRARGGKLLIYHGWNDGGSGGAISPQNSVNYYSSVLTRMGSQQQDWRSEERRVGKGWRGRWG